MSDDNTNELLRLIASLRTKRLDRFGGDSGSGAVDEGVDAGIAEGANVVSSQRNGSEDHAVLLDLDVPAYLVPSTTPGHTHLYVDVRCKEEDYFGLLDALVRCGVIELGYAQASKAKGGTYLRLPWVKADPDAA